jgi:dTDP-4-dehydrorhamnose reductase
VALAAAKYAPQFKIVPLTRALLDLTDFAGVERKYQADRPVCVIHCAAISRPVDCQANPDASWKVNVEATAHLAGLSADARMIFFSSDLVFDGKRPFATESDTPNPLHIYGENKLAAELLVLKYPRHAVVRTSLNSGVSPSGSRSFNEEMALAWRAGRSVKLFVDEFRCPIPSAVTARAVWELVLRDCSGLFHLAGSERLSRAQIGRVVAAKYPELATRIEEASRLDFQGPPRAADVSLDCSKVQRLLSFPLPAFSRLDYL